MVIKILAVTWHTNSRSKGERQISTSWPSRAGTLLDFPATPRRLHYEPDMNEYWPYVCTFITLSEFPMTSIQTWCRWANTHLFFNAAYAQWKKFDKFSPKQLEVKMTTTSVSPFSLGILKKHSDIFISQAWIVRVHN